MKTQTVLHDRALSQIAERQMRAWSLQLQAQQQVAETPASTPVAALIHPYLAISREAGANGGELALHIAKHLPWRVFDRELLDYLAEKQHWSRLSLEFVDEKTSSWFHEMFGKWLDRQLVSQAEYVRGLGRTVLVAAQHESVIFVGRGVQFILPRESGSTVRIIAPLKQRIETIMQLRNCSRHEAERFIEVTDQGRREFVQRYFHHDIADPHLYDLVINLAHVSLEEAADLIAGQCQHRFPDAAAKAS
jgi:hypothetical protein